MVYAFFYNTIRLNETDICKTFLLSNGSAIRVDCDRCGTANREGSYSRYTMKAFGT